jgi:tetratricopeptide (TPR) repeat protein
MPTLPALAIILALAASSRGPSPEEQRLYDEGARAYQAGDARAAEKSWRAGYAVGHDPAFLVHIGEAQEKAGAPAEALESYRRYLREAPDASDRADIEGRIGRLAPAAQETAPMSGAPTTPAAPPGSPAEETGEFGGSPGAPAAPPPRTAPAPRTATGPESPSGPAAADSGWNRYNVTAFIAAGASVLLLGTAAFFAAKASSDSTDIDRLVIYRDEQTSAPASYSSVAAQYERAMADGPRHDRYAKAALYGAVGAAAVSVLFFVLDGELNPEPAVALAPSGNGLGAQASWTWRF